MAVNIDVQGNWNAWSPNATHDLILTVYEIMSAFVGSDLALPLIVENDFHRGSPLAHYKKQNGCYKISLSTPSGDYWCQVALQLSHELSHLYCNFSLVRNHKHKWLEESLCEVASITTLYKLHDLWDESRMYVHNPNYAVHIHEYVEARVSAVSPRFNSKEEFSAWLIQNIDTLEACPINRELNNVIALYLYDNFFKGTPSLWRAVTHLNRWNCAEDQSTNEFLNNWLRASDESDTAVSTIVDALYC